MDRKLAEHCRIAERLEHRPMQFRAEVDLARGVVAKPEPDRVSGDVPGLDDVLVHVTPRAERVRRLSLADAWTVRCSRMLASDSV
jgi:hypothetical protein